MPKSKDNNYGHTGDSCKDGRKEEFCVYRAEEVPILFRELFIRTGYRNPNSSALQCLKSIVEPHNEMVNVWTHLLPAIYFAWQLLSCWEDHDFFNDPYSTPLLILLLTSVCYLMASSFAHLFNTMSELARYVCFFCDYAALSWYSLGSAVAYRMYSLPDGMIATRYADYYLYAAMLNSIVCTITACMSKYIKLSPLATVCRMSTFFVPYTFDNIPVIYRIINCNDDQLGCAHDGIKFLAFQQMFAMATAATYCLHIPERLKPYMFDIYGHSHQFFHVFGVFATYYQLKGVMADVEIRKSYLTENRHSVPSSNIQIGMCLVIALVNFVTVLFFSIRIRKKHPEWTRVCDASDNEDKYDTQNNLIKQKKID